MGGKSFFDINVVNAEGVLTKTTVLGGLQENLMKDSCSSSDCPLVETRRGKVRRYCGRWSSSITFAISLSLSYLLWHTDIFQKTLSPFLVLKPGTRIFEVWQEDPVPAIQTIYLFNYTNVVEFEAGQHPRLRVEEIGPFVYRIETKRVNITFNDNGTVSFQEERNYVFLPEASNGSLDSLVVLPNMPYLSALNLMVGSYFWNRMFYSSALDGFGNKPFVTVSAGDFIWGYGDTLVTLAAKTKNVPFEKAGILVGKNGTQPDIINMYTGESDISKKGVTAEMNGKSSLNLWRSLDCNKIDGTITPAIPPFQGKKTRYLYTKDSCRKIPFNYKDTRFSRGVSTLYYEVAKDFLSNAGENSCYCGDKCLPAGLLNLSACAFGAPILGSLPHFLYGEESLLNHVDGLQPNEEIHNSYLNIQEGLGIIVDGSTSFQMNILLRKSYGVSLNKHYKDEMVLPISWVRLSLDNFPSHVLWELQAVVALYIASEFVVFYVPIIVAILSLFAMLYRQKRKYCLSKSSSKLRMIAVEI